MKCLSGFVELALLLLVRQLILHDNRSMLVHWMDIVTSIIYIVRNFGKIEPTQNVMVHHGGNLRDALAKKRKRKKGANLLVKFYRSL